jgi:gas vesicle protein
MNDGSRVMAGAALGALCGAAVAYLFFTKGGRDLRDRIEPSVDDLRGEFARLQKAVEKVGDLARDGIRVAEEFRARAHADDLSGTTSH